MVVNQTCPDYDVVPDAKSGKAGEPVEMRFTKAEYDSLEAVIEEVFASYVNLTRQNDNFFVAMHPLHIRVAEHVLKGKRIIATFLKTDLISRRHHWQRIFRACGKYHYGF